MPDYMFMLESRLSAEQRAVITRMQELGALTTTNVYLAGGAVRDLISGMPIRDVDFVLEGVPTRFLRELEKGGARAVTEDEKLRHAEMVFAGDVEGSIAAARDEVYVRPGTTPENRWSTIMEDLRRRDFSVNAIALSLNPNSRGLLLDPTNGLADLETLHEVRALSIHSFTNQPVRLLRALRFAARMGFALENRTQEWFELALERGLQNEISQEAAGEELRQAARDDKAAAILKSWEARGLLSVVSPHLAKRHPDYEAISRLNKAREELLSAGLRPRLAVPSMLAIIGRLKSREQSALLHKLKFRAAEIDAILGVEAEAKKLAGLLASRKAANARDAYNILEKAPLELIAYLLAESSNSSIRNKIRAYMQKWRPLRLDLPAAANELEAIGMARGPKFDKVVEDFFSAQLSGRAKMPEDRTKLLRKLSGIKEPPPKKIKEPKKKTGKQDLIEPAPPKPAPAEAKAAAPAKPAKPEAKKSAPKAAAKKAAPAKKPAKGKSKKR